MKGVKTKKKITRRSEIKKKNKKGLTVNFKQGKFL